MKIFQKFPFVFLSKDFKEFQRISKNEKWESLRKWEVIILTSKICIYSFSYMWIDSPISVNRFTPSQNHFYECWTDSYTSLNRFTLFLHVWIDSQVLLNRFKLLLHVWIDSQLIESIHISQNEFFNFKTLWMDLMNLMNRFKEVCEWIHTSCEWIQWEIQWKIQLVNGFTILWMDSTCEWIHNLVNGFTLHNLFQSSHLWSLQWF